MLPETAARDSAELFRPGENCWKVAEAERLALLVDGEAYFDAFAQAAEAARHSIFILAWDFDSRTPLYRVSAPQESRFSRVRRRVRTTLGKASSAGAVTLGDFLNALTWRQRRLQIRVLIWDYPMIFGLDREFPPLYGLGWRPRRRVHVRYDNTQPVGASHHQKVVVIDDRVAFCGGLDLTSRRWDTCRHHAHEPRRIAGKTPYPPFHDAMMAVSGEAARALGELARERWALATGDRLPPAHIPNRRWRRTPPQAWPQSLEVHLQNIPVGIARTLPPMNGRPAVREIEQLYLDMISQARHSIYIENQYFTAHRLGAALAKRLAEPDGPEVILILRLLSHGWLEALSMEALRTQLIRLLQQADHGGRFRFFYPDVAGLPEGECIDVHSKLMVIDDRILRIGSANLSNRSMGLDTECDLTVEVRDDAAAAQAIADFRNGLLAEHLDVPREDFARAHEKHGTLRDAIEALRRDPRSMAAGRRTLRQFGELKEISPALAGVVSLADPEQPVSIKQLLPQFAPTDGTAGKGPAWGQLAMIAGLLLVFAAAWRWTPLAEFATPQHIKLWAGRFADASWAPWAVLLAYTPASVIMFPRPLITLFGVIAFGPWLGFALAMAGNLLTGWLSYLAGEHTGPETLRRLAGPNFGRISKVLRQRGVSAVTAVRLVPLAPYAIPGMVAGAAHVRLWHFMAGTFLGLLPGVLATTVFGDAVQAALDDPGKVNYWVVGSVVTVFVAGTWWVRKWLLTTRLHEEPDPGEESGTRG